MWDTTASSSESHVVYSGPALRSRTRYHWSVQVWTNHGGGGWSAPTWFETAYMNRGDWKGAWVSGPQRTPGLLTDAQAAADDACCWKPDTTLAADADAGATVLKVGAVTGMTAGNKITVGTSAAAQTVALTEIGSPATSTTLASAAAAGDGTLYVASVANLVQDAPLSVGGETVKITRVGTAQQSARSLTAPAAAGDTDIKVSNVNGFVVGQPAIVGTGEGAQRRTVAAVGTPGATGSGVTLDAPLTAAYPAGTVTRGLGSGISVSPALGAPQPSGSTIRTTGTGVRVSPALNSAQPAGTAVTGPQPAEFCRPSNGSPASGACKEIRPAPLLRKDFTVAPVSQHGRVVSARVYASGLGWNEMTLNGAKTDPKGFLNPGFTSYDRTVQYTTDDITKLVRQDGRTATRNVIASQLGSGRFDSEATSGNHGWERAEWRANPTLRADLYVKYADGTEQLIKTDGTWKASAAGPIRYDNFDLGETYDARREVPGWNTAGADASGWPAARTVDGPSGVLTAHKSDRTQQVAQWPAGTRTEPVSRVYVWNTGQQRTGWATVSVHGAPKGTPIQIRYAEKLGADGSVSISGYAPAGQIQTDYYIAKGTGTADRPEVFTPRFTFKGFQYVQISAVGGTALPDGVTARVDSVQEVRTALRETGAFTSSNDLLNRVYKATKASVVANHQAGYMMDTPTYEKDGWTGDAQLMAPTVSLMYDTRRQYRKTAQDMVDDQLDNGEVSLLTPGNRLYGYSDSGTFKPANGGSTPIWDALLFVAPWESYQRHGDTRPLTTAYPAMKKYLIEWIPKWFAADGDAFAYTLTSGLGDWNVPTGADAPEGAPTKVSVPTIISPSSTAYVAYMATIAADTARALGKHGEAAQFDTLFNHIKADYNAKWWDEQAGYYRENPDQILAQSAQALPLAFGLVPDGKRKGLQEKLVNDVLVTRAGHEEVGIAGSRWIFPVLTQAAHEGVRDAARAAYTIATQTTYPSYGYWQSLGWTGLGEYWESTSRTRNHEMFGSIGQWMYEDLVGIQALEPGYRRISIKPLIVPGLGIDRASASYASVQGKIASNWERKGSAITLDVTIPANTTALVHVPASNPAMVTETGTGRTVPADKAPGVKSFGAKDGYIIYSVGSGTYTFRTR